jgi:hypothetical protein
VENLKQDPLIPAASEVRERLSRSLEEVKLLRKQLKVSEDASAEEYRRRSRSGIYRFRKGGQS